MAKHNDKGNLLEAVVAKLHVLNGYQIETKKKYPALGNNKRKREIDILISIGTEPYRVSIPVECKNFKKKVDIAIVDGHIGKLVDVGLPPQGSVIVSSKGFSKHAKEHANNFGIKLWTLDGLTEDNLSSEIIFQLTHKSVIAPIVTRSTVVSESKHGSIDVYSSEGKFACTIFDIAALLWAREDNLEIGKRVVAIETTGKYFAKVGNNIVPIRSIEIEFTTLGHVVTERHSGEYGALKSDSDIVMQYYGVLDKDAMFGSRVSVLESEEELLELGGGKPISVTIDSRIKAPRIIVPTPQGNLICWPPDSDFENAAKQKLNQGSDASTIIEKLAQPIINVSDLFKFISTVYLSSLRKNVGEFWEDNVWNRL